MARLLTKLQLSVVILLIALSGLVFPGSAIARYSALVVDFESGQELYARHSEASRYPASLTKIMTLYLVFEALDNDTLALDQRIGVSRRAAGQAPSKLGVAAGKTISVEDAILALVTRSANDIATALAEALAGTEFQFALKMTKKARALGMKKTTFQNASGLPNRRQVTTARDMVKLARAIQNDFPHRYHYFAVRKFAHGGRTHYNHNKLLGEFEGTDGIKTGYIRASGFNLVASVERGGRRLIGVVFGGRSASSRDAHMRNILAQSFTRLEKPTNLASMAVVETRHLTSQSGIESWKVQVGAFARYSAAEKQAHAARDLAPDLLRDAIVSVAPLSTNGKTLYRARLTQLSRAIALDVCRLLQRQKVDCLPLAPAG